VPSPAHSAFADGTVPANRSSWNPETWCAFQGLSAHLGDAG